MARRMPEKENMKKIAALVLAFASATSFADSYDTACGHIECPAGTKAITFASKADPYFACPTKELSDYTAIVIGFVSIQASLTRTMPNISPETGEPEYFDGPDGKPNQSRLLLDAARHAARVRTFDEAISLCKPGKNKVHVTVMNNPKDSNSVWVADSKTKTTFWISKGMLNKE